MKFISSFFKENKSGIKTLLALLIGLLVVFYLAKLVGQHKIILLGGLILAPIVVFIISDEYKTEIKLKKFQTFVVGFLAFVSFMGFMAFSHFETYLDKHFIKGTVSSYTTEIEDDRGRIGYSEEKEFKPLDPTDNYKVYIIRYSLVFLLIGSPLLVWYMVKRKIKIIEIEFSKKSIKSNQSKE